MPTAVRNRHPRSIKLGPGRVLKTISVFDTYWRFAAQRQALFMQRVLGTPPPWTDDPVLAGHRFTNVYRAADRVSQYLIRHVLYEGPQTSEEIFFRALLFKFFNQIETWQTLTDVLGPPSWSTFEFERYARVLDGLMRRGERVYSAAYIMPSPAFGSRRKHRNHLRLLEHLMRDGVSARVERARSLQGVSNGSSIAMQVARAITLEKGVRLWFELCNAQAAGGLRVERRRVPDCQLTAARGPLTEVDPAHAANMAISRDESTRCGRGRRTLTFVR